MRCTCLSSLLSFALLLSPPSWALDTVDIAEVQVAGIDIGSDPKKAKEALGPPNSTIGPCNGCIDQPMTWAGYGGMKVWFSYDEVFSFVVSSPEFRLRSGLGVGSSREEVLAKFGDGLDSVVDDAELITYKIQLEDGYISRAVLEFTLVDDVVTEFVVTPR